MKIIILAIRALFRFRLYTVINIFGLALSLACCITISRYVYREIMVDQGFSNIKQLYLTARMQPEKNQLSLFPGKSLALVKLPVQPLEDPAVEKASTFISLPDANIMVNNQRYNVHIAGVDSLFLQILDYQLVNGNRNTVFSNPENAVITKRYATKLFGKQDPIGKNISYGDKVLTITGVIDETDAKYSLLFDLLISLDIQYRWPPILNYSVALLSPEANIKQVNDRIHTSYNKWDHENRYFQFVPLQELYFNKAIDLGERTFLQGNKAHIIILSAIALLVLLVGVFNFINIYTVVILKRGREFGMKKVFGANAVQVFSQLFIENFVQIGVALFIGWTIIEVSKGAVEARLGISSLSAPSFNCFISLLLLFGLPVITTLYPFMKYNYSAPVTSLKSVNAGGNSSFTRPLFLSLQYIITFCIIVVSLFFMKQLNYMLHADPGYRTTDIIKTHFQRPDTKMMFTDEDIDKLQLLSNQIQQRMDASPLFSTWTYGSSPHELPESNLRVKVAGNEFRYVSYVESDDNYFDLYKLTLKEGRLWDNNIDAPGQCKMIINESAKKLLGIKDINATEIQPIRKLFYNQEETHDANPPYKIVGVIADFQSAHLSNPTVPMIFTYGKGSSTNKLMAQIVPGRKQEAVVFLKKLHDEMIGGEFEYSFLEDEIRNMYSEDKKVTFIYTTFALIAILISSLGLFSLSLFDVQHKYKEIALRKINGASISSIIRLLLKKYYLLLSISFIIAIPLSLLAITKYMESFANRTALSWWIFALAAVITGCISFVTLIFQTRKAANGNPSEILKND